MFGCSMFREMEQDGIFAGHLRPMEDMMANLFCRTVDRSGQSDAMSLFGQFQSFGSMFGNMDRMIGDMGRAFTQVSQNGDGYSFHQSSVMLYSKTGDDAPKIYQVSTARRGPGAHRHKKHRGQPYPMKFVEQQVVNANSKPITDKCSRNCVVCDMLDRGCHKRPYQDQNFPGEQVCSAYNLIYAIHCDKCKEFMYVGETSRSLKERIKEHEADIRLGRQGKLIAEHFNSDGHTEKHISVTILEKIGNGSRYLRLIKELWWIKKLNTSWPYGLNTKNKLDVL